MDLGIDPICILPMCSAVPLSAPSQFSLTHRPVLLQLGVTGVFEHDAVLQAVGAGVHHTEPHHVAGATASREV